MKFHLRSATCISLILWTAALAAQTSDPAARRRPGSVTSQTINDGSAGLLDLNGSTSPFTTSGVFLQALTSGKPNVSAKLATSDAASSFSIFNSADTSLLSVNGLGRVGIGTTSPATDLHVVTTATAMPRGVLADQFGTASGRMIIRKARGTPGAPSAVVQPDAIGSFYVQAFDGSAYIDPASIRFFVDGAVSVGHVPTGMELRTGDGPFTTGSGLPRLTITSAGLVGIGTTNPPTALLTVGDAGGTGNKLTVNGDITVTGNVAAKYQDVAEWVSAGMELEAATVVVLDPSHDDQVMPSSRSYDTTVAGVVSAQPGLILGEGAKGKEKVATTGRVKVKVDATREPIAIGDLLVTSDVPGTAMKSQPLDINGRRFHQPGTIIGKALQPLAGGKGEILVLLSLQ